MIYIENIKIIQIENNSI